MRFGPPLSLREAAGNRDLLGPGGDVLVQSRQRFADELAAAVEAIGVVRSLALKD